MNINPGPGEYAPRDTLSKERVRTPLLKNGGSRFIADNDRKDSPGPGFYYKDENFARNATPITIKGKGKELIPKD